MLRELHRLVRVLVMAARDQRDAPPGGVHVDLDHAHALLVGHRPELTDVADAVVAFQLQARNAVFQVGRIAFFVQLVILGERRRQSGPHAFQDGFRVFPGFVPAVFHGRLRRVLRALRRISGPA
ncbi:hypothetical protein D3C83_03870 [compost metagenome]